MRLPLPYGVNVDEVTRVLCATHDALTSSTLSCEPFAVPVSVRSRVSVDENAFGVAARFRLSTALAAALVRVTRGRARADHLLALITRKVVGHVARRLALSVPRADDAIPFRYELQGGVGGEAVPRDKKRHHLSPESGEGTGLHIAVNAAHFHGYAICTISAEATRLWALPPNPPPPMVAARFAQVLLRSAV